ncbi:response regulator [Flavobacterium sp.]|uniref:response regulator n=1 Tax=Flavobacterium sp. TaxID=239 RepID=UPI0039E336C9
MDNQQSINLRHIYLADDDPDDRQMFSEALSIVNSATKLFTSEDGLQLMDALYVPPFPLPDIIFLDINMPKQTGLECLSAIRRHNHLQNLVIVMLTTSNSYLDMETAFTAGASGYCVKCNSFEGLKKMIAKVLDIDWRVYEVSKSNFMLS